MFEVIGLMNYGTWLRIDETALAPDSVAISLARRGYCKIVKYHLTNPDRWHIEANYKKLIEQSKALNMKVKAYKKFINHP